MTNLSIVSQDEVSENQVIRSRVAKTQQPEAERLNTEKCVPENGGTKEKHKFIKFNVIS